MKVAVRVVLFTLFAISIAGTALAHEGHQHKLLGTVKMVHENHLMLTLKDGDEKTVVLTEKTVILQGDKKVDRSSLEEGVRVSVEVDNDDNALTVKVAPAEHEH